jgi:hypothetical protein
VATIDRTNATGTRNRLLMLALGLLAVGAVVVLIINLARPPQMGADEEVFNTVDALFTAVTARDEKLLGQCEQRLHALKDGGNLPTDAAAYLDNVIQKAHDGRWEAAAEKLYDFMKAQRRESAEGRPTANRNKERPDPRRK